jgi:uncharacterized protein (TIGR03437 family)
MAVTTSVVPGQLLTIFGNNLTSGTTVSSPENGFYPNSYGGVQIEVEIGNNQVAAPLLYVSPTQINLQVPFEVADASNVKIINGSVASVMAVAPALFEVQVDLTECSAAYPGRVKTLAINQDGSNNGCQHPAAVGSTVTVFLNGLGFLPTALTRAVTPGTAEDSGLVYEGAPVSGEVDGEVTR